MEYVYEELIKGREQMCKMQESEKKLTNHLKLKSKIVAEQDRKIVEKEGEITQLIDFFKNMIVKIPSLSDEINRIIELKKKSSDSDQEMNILRQNDTRM